MNVPFGWLKTFVDLDVTPEALAERLTFSGIEVEGIVTVGEGLEGVVAAAITDVQPHPSADRLKVCRVNAGSGELRVVCGAPNVRAGDLAAFAPAGVTLPNGMRIRETRLRGEVSQGMLCAEDELGLSDDHAGLLLLPPETAAAAGTPLGEVLGLPETVMELEITWNRPDCLSMIGIAREVAALYGKTLRLPETPLAESDPPAAEQVEVLVEDPGGCPRYTARVLTGVRMGASPPWMQQRLRLCGMRPISNVVDITNYVLLECGQPLHAFDAARLQGGRIVVRRAAGGETIRTLDDTARTLTPDVLVIADAGSPVAVAGIMGGAGSEVGTGTSTVVLESAFFDPALVHRGSVALGLGTEASRHFERGVDLENVEWASRRAAGLMAAHAGATVSRGVVDVRVPSREQAMLTCRYGAVNDLLGCRVEPGTVTAIFERLGLDVAQRSDESCTVRVPSFRKDLEREADLVEEVARMHGLDAVPEKIPAARVVPDADDTPSRAVAACRANLAGLGLREAMHYSFVSAELLDRFDGADAASRVVLPNPVSADFAVLRNSLLPQMVETLGRNLAHQNADAALFEIGKVFTRGGPDSGVVEAQRVCLGLMGAAGRTGPDGNRPVRAEEAFLGLKGIVEALLEAQQVRGAAFEPRDVPGLEHGWSAAVTLERKDIGRLGVPAAALRHQWRLPEGVAVAELDLGVLCARIFDPPELVPVSPYPAVRRDVAAVVDEGTSHEAVLDVIRKNAPPELTSVTLFDTFKGEGLGENRKSLAYALTYRSLERSLTDEDANRYHEAIKEALRRELKAAFREQES
jgi:phenylalanyl-tRNA synthetase beta chain